MDNRNVLLIYNAQILNVFTSFIQRGAVLCKDGLVHQIFDEKEKIPEMSSNVDLVDAKEQYLLPGFIDAHTHIEMSQLSAMSKG